MPSDPELTLTRDEVRCLDAAAMDQLGIPGLVLMENAARGVCDVILSEFREADKILIACGFGNNGGDGFALARQLAAHGVQSEIWLVACGKSQSADAAHNMEIITAAGVSVREIQNVESCCTTLAKLKPDDLIVDCLLGTGIQGAVREPFHQLIEFINTSPADVLAVDLPSGLDCDLGTAEGACIRAQRTVTFAGLKSGFANPAAAKWTGTVSVAHIGLPREWVQTWLEATRAAP